MKALLGVMAAIWVLGTAYVTHAQCTKDTECKGQRICVSGQCVDNARTANPAVQPALVPPAGPALETQSPPPQVPPVAISSDTATAPGPQVASLVGAATVQAQFVPQDARRSYSVRSNDAGQQGCEAPCVLNLPLGTQQVIVRGDRSFSSRIVVPPQGGTYEIGKRTRKGLLAFGIILDGVGLVAIIAGAVLINNPSTEPYSYTWNDSSSEVGYYTGTGTRETDTNKNAGTGLLVAGPLVFTGGLLMTIFSVARGKGSVTLLHQATGKLERPKFALAPTSGGAAAGASWRF